MNKVDLCGAAETKMEIVEHKKKYFFSPSITRKLKRIDKERKKRERKEGREKRKKEERKGEILLINQIRQKAIFVVID